MPEFQRFISDSRLSFVIESLKKATDIFDIISHLENQHSEILRWLFDSREGHGQGDAIFKDFLTAAYFSCSGNVFCNKAFFEKWRPSKIACTGFHSLFSIREYVLPSNKRLDLLMIDMANKIIVVVENKFGARIGSNQLSSYYDEVADVLRKRPVFDGFLTAHIVLDRNLNAEKIEENGVSCKWNRWAFLDYSWLEAGAKRAEHQLRRGNQSAELVIAYCQRQISYASPDGEKIDDALAGLAGDYRQVINDIFLAGKIDVAELTPTNMQDKQGDLWHFANHYPEVVERLKGKVALSFMVPCFKRRYPSVEFKASNGQRWLNLFDARWDGVAAADAEHWPIYLCIWDDGSAGNDQLFVVGVSYHSSMVDDEFREHLFNELKEEFPELGKGRQDAGRRMLGKVSGLTQKMVEAQVTKLYDRLVKVISPILP